MELNAVVLANDSVIWDILPPEPVRLPNSVNLFNGDVLCLRQEEEHENSHNDYKAGKEKEETELQVAEHGEENLSDEKGEQHVDGDVDGLACRSDLQRADLAGYQPTQWPPRPCERRYVRAD